ncbi:MAG: hypothetical protein E6Q97_00990 [Desulfurellales bacterium]|nr:MAG: hypothetical protein E6Q97_00990 [Desulfurellales bacterium]
MNEQNRIHSLLFPTAFPSSLEAQLLVARHGAAAISVYLSLLCFAGATYGGKLPGSRVAGVAIMLRLEESELRAIVSTLAEMQLVEVANDDLLFPQLREQIEFIATKRRNYRAGRAKSRKAKGAESLSADSSAREFSENSQEFTRNIEVTPSPSPSPSPSMIITCDDQGVVGASPHEPEAQPPSDQRATTKPPKKPLKRQYGERGNVFLSEAEAQSVRDKFGEPVLQRCIDKLDAWIESDRTIKRIRNGHNAAATFRSWVLNAVAEEQSRAQAVGTGPPRRSAAPTNHDRNMQILYGKGEK